MYCVCGYLPCILNILLCLPCRPCPFSQASVSAGREYYVRKLRGYIKVDVFGACGERQCPKDRMNDCYTKVLRPTYKFYLAFENNLCDDYLTEKVREMGTGDYSSGT